MMLVVFDIGGTRMRAARSAAPGVVEPLGEVPTPGGDFGAFVQALAGFLRGDEVGVALSVPGCFDPDTGRAIIANIPCLDGRRVEVELSAALGLPVRVFNDADCFAMAETGPGGAAEGLRNVFGIILGTGVGGGLIVDGRLVAGPGGYAGEWGHGPVLNERPLGREVPRFTCGCGQVGCLDTVGGARGLERLHRHLTGEEVTSQEVLAGWHGGDVGTVEVWLDLVAGPLAMVLNTVGAQLVPVGGGLSNDEGLIAALDTAVRARVLRRTDAPLVVRAKHRVEPGLIGASMAGWSHVD